MLASIIDLDTMLPYVGQGAIGLEIREHDPRIAKIIARINHAATFHAVTAESARFLRAHGRRLPNFGQAAYAQVSGNQVSLKAISFHGKKPKHAQGKKAATAAATLGEQIAKKLK